MQKSNALDPGTRLRGTSYNYIVEKVLGQGTFGITYLAKIELQGGLGTLDSSVRVTIKEFFMREINGREGSSVTSTSNNRGGLFYEYKRKFAIEAQNLSKLKHPHIVNVMEFFEANNTYYYVMEFLGGGDLDRLIMRNGALSEDETAKYVMQMGSALSFMHQNKMLHLDLKPKNVMLNSNGDAILIDFGLSKQYDKSGEPESSTTVGRGTPGYAPLEQSTYQNGHGFPVTMDVYALGATMYKMLTGVRAPEASVILNEGFPTIELVNKRVSGALIGIIEKAMSPMKKNRYQSIREMLYSLSECKLAEDDAVIAQLEETEITAPQKVNDIRPKRVELYDPAAKVYKFSFELIDAYAWNLEVHPRKICMNFGGHEQKTVKISRRKYSDFLDFIRKITIYEGDKSYWGPGDAPDEFCRFSISLYNDASKKQIVNHLNSEGWCQGDDRIKFINGLSGDGVEELLEYVKKLDPSLLDWIASLKKRTVETEKKNKDKEPEKPKASLPPSPPSPPLRIVRSYPSDYINKAWFLRYHLDIVILVIIATMCVTGLDDFVFADHDDWPYFLVSSASLLFCIRTNLRHEDSSLLTWLGDCTLPTALIVVFSFLLSLIENCADSFIIDLLSADDYDFTYNLKVKMIDMTIWALLICVLYVALDRYVVHEMGKTSSLETSLGLQHGALRQKNSMGDDEQLSPKDTSYVLLLPTAIGIVAFYYNNMYASAVTFVVAFLYFLLGILFFQRKRKNRLSN